MLFDICGRIQNSLNINQLNRAIEQFFNVEVTVLDLSQKKHNVLFECIVNNRDMGILLVQNTSEFSYESDLIGSDYCFSETVTIEIYKASGTIDKDYRSAVEFLVFLSERFSIEMLITMDFEEEICFISSDGYIKWNKEEKNRFTSNADECRKEE